MNITKITPILNVSDVPASIAWFEKLGWRACFTYNPGGMILNAARTNEFGHATFAGIEAGEYEIFLCQDGQGARGKPGVIPARDAQDAGMWMSWWLETPAELDSVYELAVQLGYGIAAKPRNEIWGCREFLLCHPDGHVFRISAQLTHD